MTDPRDDYVELPAPTAWPMVAALGITLGFAGLVTNGMVTIVGVVLTIAGAVGWWRFNEAAGGVSSDSSGHNHTATLQAGASLSAGHAGSALYLSASSQRAVVADAADLDITSAITPQRLDRPG